MPHTPTWFPVERQALSLDFANTRYLRGGVLTDGLAGPGGVNDWTAAVGLPRVPAAAVPGLVRLRDAVRDVLRASVEGRRPPAAALRAVNEAARAAPAWPELDGYGTAARTRRDADPAANLGAQLAGDLIGLLAGAERPLLRACPAEGCQGIFLQRDRRRDFCSPGCATRTRVARHYRRHHPDPA